MLTAHHLTKSYGIQSILKDVSFNIHPGDRVGLIGPNGCGKTTLLRLLTGREQPDSGSVTFTRPGLRLGYLAQGCTFLLLDEPTNHLDIPSRARFEQSLAKYTGSVLAVVHDRYFIDAFATAVWTVADGQIIT